MIINAKAYITGVHDPERPRRLVKLPCPIGLSGDQGFVAFERGRREVVGAKISIYTEKSPKTGALSVGFQK